MSDFGSCVTGDTHLACAAAIAVGAMSSPSAMAGGSCPAGSETDTEPGLDLHSPSDRVKVLEQSNVLAVQFESDVRSR